MTESIPCNEAIARLWRYLDDELDETGHRLVEDHLVWCLRCCGELEFARELKSLLATGREVEMDDDVRRHLEAFIDELGVDPDTKV